MKTKNIPYIAVLLAFASFGCDPEEQKLPTGYEGEGQTIFAKFEADLNQKYGFDSDDGDGGGRKGGWKSIKLNDTDTFKATPCPPNKGSDIYLVETNTNVAELSPTSGPLPIGTSTQTFTIQAGNTEAEAGIEAKYPGTDGNLVSGMVVAAYPLRTVNMALVRVSDTTFSAPQVPSQLEQTANEKLAFWMQAVVQAELERVDDVTLQFNQDEDNCITVHETYLSVLSGDPILVARNYDEYDAIANNIRDSISNSSQYNKIIVFGPRLLKIKSYVGEQYATSSYPNGWAPINGDVICIDGTEEDITDVGTTISHEMGHSIGADHDDSRDENIMHPTSSDTNRIRYKTWNEVH